MDADDSVDLGSNSIRNHLSDEHETVLMTRPEGLLSPVETALEQYADSIERLSTDGSAEADPYTRGFVAGLRAAIKVAANVARICE